MSKLSELIQQYCSDGVIYSTVGKKLGVNRGKRLTKSQLLNNGKYTVYHGSKYTPLGFYASSNVKGNTTIVVNTGGIGGVKYCEENFWCSDGSFWIGHTDDMNDKFVYYWISKFEEWFTTQKRVGGVPTIDRDTVASIEIPVPPMPVQEEIVRILDKFTELETELETELSMRKKQYEYYRDKLLSLEDYEGEVKLVHCQECTYRLRGSSVTAGYMKNMAVNGGTIIIFGGGATRVMTDEEHTSEFKIITIPSVLVKSRGIVDVEYCDFPYTFKQEMWAYVGKEQLNTKYLYYFLQKNVQRLRDKSSQMGSMPQIKLDDTNSLEVPIIDMTEQKRIVNILDKFSKLTTDISEGLPAEIKMRHQQYEYYRDKLLNFKRLEKNSIYIT